MKRAISTTISLPLDMLERLTVLAERLRLPKSVIIQEALNREFERYEQVRKVDAQPVGVGSGGGVKEPAASRP